MSTALNPLVEKIRAKYPGAYDDMDDAALTKAIIKKYPQYSDLAAPLIAKPNVSMQEQPMGPGQKFAAQLGENADAVAQHVGPAVKQVANDVYDISTPGIAAEIKKRLEGKPNNLAQLPPKMVMGFLAAGGVPEGEAAQPAEALASKSEPIAAEAAPRPMAPVQPTPATPVSQPIKPNLLQQQIEQGLGNEPLNLKPNVPLREQLPSVKPKPADIPEGHTPVDSSAVKSFKYDADAKEFHAKPSAGKTVYVYGDVSREEAEAFAKADSKGKAWMQIRNNPLVAKIVDGKRIAVKPVASDDLTSLLQQSLDQAKAVKAAAGND